METSDSECFESADEDFQSDTEAGVEKTEICHKQIKQIQHEINSLNLSHSKRRNSDSDKKSDENEQALSDKAEEKVSAVDNSRIPLKNKSVTERNERSKFEELKAEETGNEAREPGKGNRRLVQEQNSITEITEKSRQKPKLGTKVARKVLEPESAQIQPDTTESKPETIENTKETEESDENLWGDDEAWETEGNLWKQEELNWNKKTLESQNWAPWGIWGTTILSTATQSVSTLTSQVSKSLSTVLETGMGVPDPEELARQNKLIKEHFKQYETDSDEENKSQPFHFGSLVSGVTKFVEATGTKVISGGLDTLETIGKKTMEVLQEGDPGLKRKRAFLKIDQDKPVLSQLLREAKEKAEEENRLLEQKHFDKKTNNYETLFDDHQGLVHLEALEMLSRQCDIKLQTLLENATESDLQETLDQIKELCELPSEEDEEEQLSLNQLKEKLEDAVKDIHISMSYSKLVATCEETETWLDMLKLEFCDERELHQQAIETLAQLTAIAVEQFHKGGELLLIKEQRSTADEADSLVQLTTTLTCLIGIVATKFSNKLHAKSNSTKDKEAVNELITNIFYEAANSSSYVRDAFQLLIPVLQVGAV